MTGWCVCSSQGRRSASASKDQQPLTWTLDRSQYLDVTVHWAPEDQTLIDIATDPIFDVDHHQHLVRHRERKSWSAPTSRFCPLASIRSLCPRLSGRVTWCYPAKVTLATFYKGLVWFDLIWFGLVWSGLVGWYSWSIWRGLAVGCPAKGVQ